MLRSCPGRSSVSHSAAQAAGFLSSKSNRDDASSDRCRRHRRQSSKTTPNATPFRTPSIGGSTPLRQTKSKPALQYGFDQHAINLEVCGQVREIFTLFETLMNAAQSDGCSCSRGSAAAAECRARLTSSPINRRSDRERGTIRCCRTGPAGPREYEGSSLSASRDRQARRRPHANQSIFTAIWRRVRRS